MRSIQRKGILSVLGTVLWSTTAHAQMPDISLVERAWAQIGFLGLLFVFVGVVLWKVYQWGTTQQQRSDKQTESYQDKNFARYEAAITAINLMTTALDKVNDRIEELENSNERIEANQGMIKTNLVNLYTLLSKSPNQPLF